MWTVFLLTERATRCSDFEKNFIVAYALYILNESVRYEELFRLEGRDFELFSYGNFNTKHTGQPP